MVTNKRVIVRFTALTFCIAYLVAGSLIVLGKVGYRVYGWVNTLPQFCMNIPFAIYILSPAIASYIVLKKNNKTINLWKWLKTVFYVKNNVYPYAFVAAGLVLYFSIHAFSLGRVEMVLPFYAFFLSIPGNLFIGGLEEAGWAYILQPALAKRFGYIVSCIITGIIWIAWHIPLFSYREQRMKKDLSILGCLPYSVWLWDFSLERSAKYRAKAMCLCAYYSIPYSMRLPQILQPW